MLVWQTKQIWQISEYGDCVTDFFFAPAYSSAGAKPLYSPYLQSTPQTVAELAE